MLGLRKVAIRPDKRVPLWPAVGVVAAALVLGFAVGRLTDHSEMRDDYTVRGVVDSTDADGGSLCVRASGDHVECYHAPGLGLKVGESVTLRIQQEPLDGTDPAMGKIAVVVGVIRQ